MTPTLPPNRTEFAANRGSIVFVALNIHSSFSFGFLIFRLSAAWTNEKYRVVVVVVGGYPDSCRYFDWRQGIWSGTPISRYRCLKYFTNMPCVDKKTPDQDMEWDIIDQKLMMMIFMFSLHGAAVPSGQLDFGSARVFKVFRVISPAVLIKLDYTIILQKQFNFMQMILCIPLVNFYGVYVLVLWHWICPRPGRWGRWECSAAPQSWWCPQGAGSAI